VEALVSELTARDCNYPPLPPPTSANNCSSVQPSTSELFGGVLSDGGVSSIKRKIEENNLFCLITIIIFNELYQ